MAIRFVENPITIRTEPLRFAHRHVRATSNEIARASRRVAPFNESPFRRPGPHLNRSINADTQITGPTRVRGDIGSNLDHALVAHEGARPHPIFPRRPGGTLRFYWARVGRWVNLPSVSHPGMEGVPYLTVPLLIIGTRRGFRVVIF